MAMQLVVLLTLWEHEVVSFLRLSLPAGAIGEKAYCIGAANQRPLKKANPRRFNAKCYGRSD
jgi:hypothetical protein